MASERFEVGLRHIKLVCEESDPATEVGRALHAIADYATETLGDVRITKYQLPLVSEPLEFRGAPAVSEIRGTEIELDGQPLWRGGLIVRVPIELFKSNLGTVFTLKGLNGKFYAAHGQCQKDAAWLVFKRDVAWKEDPCEMCGEPLTFIKAIDYIYLMGHAKRVPLRQVLVCKRGHEAR